MTCPNCRAEILENSKFCPYCGSSVTRDLDEAAYPEGVAPAEDVPASAVSPEQGMKWYHFTIYFSLFASALINLIAGIQYLSGAQYEGMADYVYYAYNGLKAVDTLYGIIGIGIAAFCIFTRFQLAGFKANAPMLLNIIYAVNAVVPLVYLGIFSSITGINPTSSSTASSVASSIVMIIINSVYYKKRKHLFVN